MCYNILKIPRYTYTTHTRNLYKTYNIVRLLHTKWDSKFSIASWAHSQVWGYNEVGNSYCVCLVRVLFVLRIGGQLNKAFWLVISHWSNRTVARKSFYFRAADFLFFSTILYLLWLFSDIPRHWKSIVYLL